MRMLNKLLFTMILKTSLTNRNQGQGRHWASTHKDRKAADGWVANSMVAVYDEDQVSVAPFKDTLAGTQLTDLVALRIVRVLGKNQRLFDFDSLGRGCSKQIIDAIVGTGLLADDNPKHVGLVIFDQDASRREDGPLVEIEFWDITNEKGEGRG